MVKRLQGFFHRQPGWSKAIWPWVFSLLLVIFGCRAQLPPPATSGPLPRPAQAAPITPPSEPPAASLPATPETTQESPVTSPSAPKAPETLAAPPPAKPTEPPRPSPPPRTAPSPPPLILSAAPKLILIPETKELFFAVVPERDLDLFFSRAEMRYYYHRKGRWYSTRHYSGPWRPVELKELPEDFQKASPIELKARILPTLLKRPGG